MARAHLVCSPRWVTRDLERPDCNFYLSKNLTDWSCERLLCSPKGKKTRLKIAIPQQHIVGKTRDSFVFQALCVLWVIIITSAALRILKIFQILTRFSHLACVSSWKTDRFVCAIIARFFLFEYIKTAGIDDI